MKQLFIAYAACELPYPYITLWKYIKWVGYPFFSSLVHHKCLKTECLGELSLLIPEHHLLFQKIWWNVPESEDICIHLWIGFFFQRGASSIPLAATTGKRWTNRESENVYPRVVEAWWRIRPRYERLFWCSLEQRDLGNELSSLTANDCRLTKLINNGSERLTWILCEYHWLTLIGLMFLY